MKETIPYWYYNTAYSMEPYFVCIDFPNQVKYISSIDKTAVVRLFIGCIEGMCGIDSFY